MQLIIHRGSGEIGGTCIQLASKNSSILLDLGSPLNKKSKEIDPNSLHADAVLISHPHQDHYGLIETMDSNTPVYIGDLGKKMINTSRLFLKKALFNHNFQHFRNQKIFNLGDFKITPYLMDHSAVDAYGFLIEAEGKRIFYSGDFRGHGKKSVLFERFVKKPPSDIDVLLMEGTMLERDNDQFPTEESVEKAIFEVIKSQENISFIISSSQNIDRIVSSYNACRRALKILVLDLYTAWVLEQIKSVSKGIRAMDWNHIKVYASHSQNQVLQNNREIFGIFTQEIYKHRVMPEEMRSQPARFLVFGKMASFQAIKSYFGTKPVNVIYSQWLGYLKYSSNEYYGAEETAAYQSSEKANFIYAHTSGHAVVEDLQTYARAVNPKQLIPIHTEHGDRYEKYFDNVRILHDGETCEL